MAGILYAELKKLEMYDMAKFGSACAQITIQHKNAVNPDICEQKVLDLLEE